MPRDSVYMLLDTFNALPWNWQLHFSPHFLLVQSLSVISLLCVPTVTYCFRHHEFNQLPVTIFDKHPFGKVFLLLVTSKSDQIRQPHKYGRPGKYQTGQIMWILWEWGPEGAPAPFCSFWQSQGLSFHSDFMVNVGWLVLKAMENLEVEIGIGQIKTAQNLLLLLRFPCFSWITSPWIAASLWSISRFLKNLFLIIFASFSIAFRGERILEGPYSVIFADITLCWFSSRIYIW